MHAYKQIVAGMVLVGTFQGASIAQSPIPTPTQLREVSPSPNRAPVPFEGARTAYFQASTQQAPGQQPSPEVLAPASSQPSSPYVLSLTDLEQMALAGNPTIAQAASLVQAARGNWIQVGLRPNPNVGYEGQQIGSRGLAEQQGIFVGQEIVRGNKLGLNREIAAQEIFRAEHQLAAQQQRVLTDVRVTYFNVLIAQRQEALAFELRRIASEGQKTAEALLKNQQAGKIDTLQAEIEFENAEILVVNSRNRRAASWDTLAAVVGQPQLPLQMLAGEVEGDTPILRRDEVLQRLLTASPEIAVAMANIERARWAAERARVEKTPNVTVQGLMNVRDNGIGGRPDGAVMVGVPLPLWNRNQGALYQAQHEAAAAERALERVELGLQSRLAPIFERYSNALNQVTRYRAKILPAAQQTLDFSRRQFEAGELGYINFLISQRTFAQTNLAYLDSLRQLREATATIDGLLLSDSLKVEEATK